jgi:hypothetical protein
MRCLVAWLGLAACSSQGALEVIVTAPETMPVKKVELYVGYSSHHDEAIRPAGGALAPTVWWKRDEDPSLDVLPMDEDGALFAFLPDGNYNGVAALIAVGLGVDDQGNDKPVGVAARLAKTKIPGDEIHRYTLQLGDFAPLPRDATSSPDVPGLRLWGPPSNRRRCAQIENVPELAIDEYRNEATGVAPMSGMIVTADDPDCDDERKIDDPTMNTECFEYEYLAQAAMLRDDLQCLRRDPIRTPFGDYNLCVAGGATCQDGFGRSTAQCSPSAYCAPSSMCCDPTASRCDLYHPPSTTQPYLECPLRMGYGSSNELIFCPNVHAKFNIAELISQYVPGLSCENTLGRVRFDGTVPWSDQAVVPNSSAVSQTRVVLAHTGIDCEFELQGVGPAILTGGSVVYEFPLTMSVPIVKPVDGRGLVLPIVIVAADPSTAYGECPSLRTDMPCFVRNAVGINDPEVAACLRSPVPLGYEVKDP